jgi:hypothetical protein
MIRPVTRFRERTLDKKCKHLLTEKKLRKSALGLSPSEDAFFRSEMKHDGGTAPSPKLFLGGKNTGTKESNPKN